MPITRQSPPSTKPSLTPPRAVRKTTMPRTFGRLDDPTRKLDRALEPRGRDSQHRPPAKSVTCRAKPLRRRIRLSTILVDWPDGHGPKIPPPNVAVFLAAAQRHVVALQI